MTNVVLGKVAFTWKGAFSTSTTYYLQDVVSYTDSSGFTSTYVCKVATATAGAFDATNNFELFASGTGVALTSGDIVYNNGTTIVALPIGTANQVLEVDATTLLPSWTSIPTASSRRAKYLAPYDFVHMNNYTRMVVMEDDSLVGWGYNGHYHIRGSNGVHYSNPSPIAFPKGFAGIKSVTGHNGKTIPAVWGHHRYAFHAIDKNNDLWTWGEHQSDSYDAKGLGSNVNAYTPRNVSQLNVSGNEIYQKDIVYLCHGSGQENEESQHVIDSEGRVYGCGYNGHGQLGLGNLGYENSTNKNYFEELPFFLDLYQQTPSVTVTKMARTREQHTAVYAITTENKIYAWGYNESGGLGRNSTGSGVFSIPTAITSGSLDPSNGQTNGVVTNVWCGPQQAYILTSDGKVSFVGRNYYGSSGTGDSGDSDKTTPVISINTGTVTQLVCSPYSYPNVWALKSDGSILFTGYNGYGQGGDGGTVQRYTWQAVPLTAADGNDSPEPIPAGETVTKIFSGGDGSNENFGVLTDAGKVYCCGWGGHGQMGKGTNSNTNNRLELVRCAKTITDAHFQGYGSYSSLTVLTDDGQVLSCGYGGNRSLGGEDDDNSHTLVPIRF